MQLFSVNANGWPDVFYDYSNVFFFGVGKENVTLDPAWGNISVVYLVWWSSDVYASADILVSGVQKATLKDGGPLWC